jgi:probable F420-dependent oxidoreductase
MLTRGSVGGRGRSWWSDGEPGVLALPDGVEDPPGGLAIATGITTIWSRDPTATAAARTTLDDAYPGRFLLGLGASHASRVADRGHDYAKPLTAMRDYLDAMAEAGPFHPAPARSGRTVLAALRPRMQELARHRTDGMHSFFVTPDHTADARSRLGSGPLLVPHQAFVIKTPETHAQALARRFVASRLALPNYVRHLEALGFDRDDLSGEGTREIVDALVAVVHRTPSPNGCVPTFAPGRPRSQPTPSPTAGTEGCSSSNSSPAHSPHELTPKEVRLTATTSGAISAGSSMPPSPDGGPCKSHLRALPTVWAGPADSVVARSVAPCRSRLRAFPRQHPRSTCTGCPRHQGFPCGCGYLWRAGPSCHP